jgi:membrane protein implicated in regulation of membrane protease activity
MLFQPYIIWFLIGLVLVLSEFALPGVILIFIGLSAWLTATTAWMGLTTTMASQMTVFSVGSITLLFGLRRFFADWFVGISKQGDAWDAEEEFVGKEVKILSQVTLGSDGKVEFKGVSWNSRSESTLKPGNIAIIVKRDGLTLIIKPC